MERMRGVIGGWWVGGVASGEEKKRRFRCESHRRLEQCEAVVGPGVGRVG
jgi:hypothetical protein